MSAHVGTKKARTHRVVLDQLRVHERDGTLPTTGRFLFYELEQRGEARKPSPDDVRPNKRRSIGWPPGSQDITDALTCMYKKDGRDGRVREAWELQALGQATLVRMLRGELDALLPEPLASVRERERAQRTAVAEFLATWDGDR